MTRRTFADMGKTFDRDLEDEVQPVSKMGKPITETETTLSLANPDVFPRSPVTLGPASR